MVDIPDRMKKLPRDARGYPIPYVVLRGPDGAAYFTINDDRRVMQCRRGDLCPICGEKLTRGRWFLGGPRSAFDARGGYFDGPMHDSCMRYSASVCPYISNPKYRHRIAIVRRVGGCGGACRPDPAAGQAPGLRRGDVPDAHDKRERPLPPNPSV